MSISDTIKICGSDIPVNKKITFSLSYVYGIGVPLARKICLLLNIDLEKRVSELSQESLDLIRRHIESNLVIEGDLRRQIQKNIKSLISIKCYRGYRHKNGLPVRGQRTKTNARTRKGKVKKIASKIKKKS